MEMSPLIDSYNQINEPKAYPIGMMPPGDDYAEDYEAQQYADAPGYHQPKAPLG